MGKQKFFCIRGEGDPNGEDFGKRVQALYSMAYAIRMIEKSGLIPEGYYEYTVYPMEGLWDLSETGRKKAQFDKQDLVYTIMIRQPEFVNNELFLWAKTVAEKKKVPMADAVYFEEIEDGLSVQILHKGPYDTEPESFRKMKDFIAANGYEIQTLVHREIYLSDARRTEPNNLRTILRYRIRKK